MKFGGVTEHMNNSNAIMTSLMIATTTVSS